MAVPLGTTVQVPDKQGLCRQCDVGRNKLMSEANAMPVMQLVTPVLIRPLWLVLRPHLLDENAFLDCSFNVMTATSVP